MGKKIKIGFYTKFHKGSLNTPHNVIGDELYAESICRYLKKFDEVEDAQLYAANYKPGGKLDVMVYLNDTQPDLNWAFKHVLYMQNGYNSSSESVLKELRKNNYDGYAFVSNKLLSLHKKDGKQGIFIPFGVDLYTFRPQNFEKEYCFDVAYVGNDIKGEFRTKKYLMPAVKFNFGLFGNWPLTHPLHRYKFWKNWDIPAYVTKLNKISRGKLPQEKLPVLYSSSKININFTLQDCVDWDVITLRTFEVLACKGFLISDKVSIAEKLLEGCVVFTDGNNDLIEKIEYYLSHEKERDDISLNGYNYVIKNASVESRARELLNYLREI